MSSALPGSRSTATTGSSAAWRSTSDYRGQGLGASLVEAALSRAGRLNLGTVYLLTNDARDYFARLGFADCPREDAPPAIRESWEFSTGCPASAAFMKRAVAGS